MTLREKQNILAKLYTDTNFRNIFFESAEYSSNPLRSLKREEIEFFAQGLINKRLGVVKSLLPLTFQFLGQDFIRFFQLYAKSYTPSGSVYKHYMDAISFALFLKNQNSFPYQWTKDLITFEKMQVETLLLNKKVIVGIFSYPVQNLKTITKASENVTKKRTIVLFLRFTSKARLFKIFIPFF